MPLIKVDVEAQTVKEQNYPQSNLNLASHALGKNTGAQGNGTFVPISIPKLDASFFHTFPALIFPLARNCALSTPQRLRNKLLNLDLDLFLPFFGVGSWEST